MDGKHTANPHSNFGGKRVLSWVNHDLYIEEKQMSEASLPLWNAIPTAVFKLVFTERGTHSFPNTPRKSERGILNSGCGTGGKGH